MPDTSEWTQSLSKNFHFTGRDRLGHQQLHPKQSTGAQPDQPGPHLRECYVKSLTNATVCWQTGVWKEISESKERQGKDKEKKLAFTHGLGTVSCFFIESTQSNFSRWPFYHHFFFFPFGRYENVSSERLRNHSIFPQLYSDRVTSSGESLYCPPGPSPFLPRPREISHPPRRQRAAFNTKAGPELAATRPSINVFFNNEVFSAS